MKIDIDRAYLQLNRRYLNSKTNWLHHAHQDRELAEGVALPNSIKKLTSEGRNWRKDEGRRKWGGLAAERRNMTNKWMEEKDTQSKGIIIEKNIFQLMMCNIQKCNDYLYVIKT